MGAFSPEYFQQEEGGGFRSLLFFGRGFHLQGCMADLRHGPSAD
jgi:hypothetical protein